jgi:hypothetical protein
MAGYQDPRIEANERGIALKGYYFPWGTKRIAWDDVTRVAEHDMGTGITGGRWRIWGSGDLLHWMPLDIRRPKKRTMFVMFLRDGRMRPCITPDEPQRFKAFLEERGVKVAPLDPGYED